MLEEVSFLCHSHLWGQYQDICSLLRLVGGGIRLALALLACLVARVAVFSAVVGCPPGARFAVCLVTSRADFSTRGRRCPPGPCFALLSWCLGLLPSRLVGGGGRLVPAPISARSKWSMPGARLPCFLGVQDCCLFGVMGGGARLAPTLRCLHGAWVCHLCGW